MFDAESWWSMLSAWASLPRRPHGRVVDRRHLGGKQCLGLVLGLSAAHHRDQLDCQLVQYLADLSYQAGG
jgi:hypothetical protein